MNQDIAIKINDMYKSFGKNKVLRGLSMEVPAGSIYAYLGRNGEGKTTTMRLLMNILTPDAGKLEVLGMDPVSIPARVKLEVGYVPEVPYFYKWMRTREILDFIADAFGNRWDSGRAQGLTRRLKLPMDSLFGDLSMGVRAKVSLVAALAHNPKVLLLDDPTSGLDAVVRRQFLETLVELVDESGCTVLFSSHIITDLERVVDRVGLLQDGQLVLDTPLEELKEKVKRFRLVQKGDAETGNLREELGSRVLSWNLQGRQVSGVLRDLDGETFRILKDREDLGCEFITMDLEEIFVALTSTGEEEGLK